MGNNNCFATSMFQLQSALLTSRQCKDSKPVNKVQGLQKDSLATSFLIIPKKIVEFHLLGKVSPFLDFPR